MFNLYTYQISIDNGAPQSYAIAGGQPISDGALNDIGDILAADVPGTGTVSEILKAEAASVTVT